MKRKLGSTPPLCFLGREEDPSPLFPPLAGPRDVHSLPEVTQEAAARTRAVASSSRALLPSPPLPPGLRAGCPSAPLHLLFPALADGLGGRRGSGTKVPHSSLRAGHSAIPRLPGSSPRLCKVLSPHLTSETTEMQRHVPKVTQPGSGGGQIRTRIPTAGLLATTGTFFWGL